MSGAGSFICQFSLYGEAFLASDPSRGSGVLLAWWKWKDVFHSFWSCKLLLSILSHSWLYIFLSLNLYRELDGKGRQHVIMANFPFKDLLITGVVWQISCFWWASTGLKISSWVFSKWFPPIITFFVFHHCGFYWLIKSSSTFFWTLHFKTFF